MLGRTYALGYEPDLDGRAAAPAAAHGAQPGVDVGGLVSAAAQRQVRAAARRRAARHPRRARRDRHVVRRRRLRARHPPGLPRPRQGRQRLRRRPDRQGSLSRCRRSSRRCGRRSRRRSTSSASGRSSSAARSGRAPTVTHESNARDAEHAEISERVLCVSACSAFNVCAQVRRRRERRRAAVLRRLLVRVRELDQRRLAPRAAEERDPDRQPADVAHRHRDVRVAGDRRHRRRPGRRCRAAVAVHEIDQPRRPSGRRDQRVELVLRHHRVDAERPRHPAILRERRDVLRARSAAPSSRPSP